ncbi:MAG: hypothetical protein RLN87_00250 [Parasphingopyxis sp.]|uniref:hypothetical protein n=1 Tax=Parasphingopyxis sp. TaxID=1920299 RepID=UPI0032EEDE60
MSAEELWRQILESRHSLKSGSLCFWGHWFGRPMDNWHTIVNAELLEDVLILYFNNAETLAVYNPSRCSLDGGRLVIGDAASIEFRWFYYGKKPDAESLQMMKIWKDGAKLRPETDFLPHLPKQDLDPNKPAVELHSSF